MFGDNFSDTRASIRPAGEESLRCSAHERLGSASFQFHNKFRIFHQFATTSLLPSRETVCEQAALHFSRIGVTVTSVRDLPHSKQHAFNRDVINPQHGHILCDPYPAICGFSLCILWSSRIVNSTIRRPKEKVVAFINVILLGDSRFDLPVVNKRRVP